MTTDRLRQVGFFADGLRYALAMSDVAGPRIRMTLQKIAGKLESEPEREELIATAFLDAWSLVDICHRVRDLIQGTPSLSPRRPEIQAFLRRTIMAEKLRHHVQHFRSVIPKSAASTRPLWGSLSWACTSDPTTCLTIVTGKLFDGLSNPSISYDRLEQRFTSEILLSTHAGEIDLAEVLDQFESLRLELNRWTEEDPTGKQMSHPTLLFRFSMQRDS